MEKSLGKMWREVLEISTSEPIGSGCVAQVYNGTLKTRLTAPSIAEEDKRDGEADMELEASPAKVPGRSGADENIKFPLPLLPYVTRESGWRPWSLVVSTSLDIMDNAGRQLQKNAGQDWHRCPPGHVSE
ncbi:hypothetical protein GBAR_LOCUS23347 [Geodia barretti]|uniref:Uncharacterized protein n=1 Tax=Geodia barretti TaxID=519541 RepID=A0AA35T5B0_GEOBA|nr:hypothetical protein GBAR_LOCUS23347 [Geodia barretti]